MANSLKLNTSMDNIHTPLILLMYNIRNINTSKEHIHNLNTSFDHVHNLNTSVDYVHNLNTSTPL